MKITYDDQTRSILRASGLSDVKINEMELRATKEMANVLKLQPQELSQNTIQRKFADDDLVPLGSSRDH